MHLYLFYSYLLDLQPGRSRRILRFFSLSNHTIYARQYGRFYDVLSPIPDAKRSRRHLLLNWFSAGHGPCSVWPDLFKIGVKVILSPERLGQVPSDSWKPRQLHCVLEGNWYEIKTSVLQGTRVLWCKPHPYRWFYRLTWGFDRARRSLWPRFLLILADSMPCSFRESERKRSFRLDGRMRRCVHLLVHPSFHWLR